MSDIVTVWNVAQGRGDWQISTPDLRAGGELASAVLISLFSDRRAEPDDDLTDFSDDRRGWWAESDFGSRLWLLERAKETQNTLQRAKTYCAEALQWLIDDGVAKAIETDARWVRRFMLGIIITVRKNDGSLEPMRFEWAWKGLT